MSYQITIGKNNEIALPDDLCDEIQVKVGDILICEATMAPPALTMKKHCDQTLSDDDIAAAGNLARIFAYATK